MIDSGATALFIHERFVKQNRMVKHRLPQEIGLRNIDGSVVETRLDTAKGDGGGEGEGDVDGGGAHDADTKSDA